MSILITGANGSIGIDLVKKLSDKYKIFGIYRTKNNEVKKTKSVTCTKHNLRQEQSRVSVSLYLHHISI